MKRQTTPNGLRDMIVETAGDLRRLGMMDDATHEKITLRHLGKAAPCEPAPITGEEIRSLREKARLSSGGLRPLSQPHRRLCFAIGARRKAAQRPRTGVARPHPSQGDRNDLLGDDKRAGGSRPLKRREKRRGFGSLGSGGKDRLLVSLQHAQPRVEILRVIGARRIGDAKIGAEERSAKFGDKLFHGVGFIAEALAELAIAAGLGARPVNELVKLGRVVGLGRRARRRTDERFAWRKLDAVRRRAVESAAAAVLDDRACRGDEGLGVLDRRDDRRGQGSMTGA